MRCFIYQAALLCEDCGRLKAAMLDQESAPDTGDSDDYPQGPFSVGEADSPQHCDACGVFLENPLTQDGRDYVANFAIGLRDMPPAMNEWLRFYAPAHGISELADWAARRAP